MGEERIGTHRSVYLGGDDALRHEAAVHAHEVGLPLLPVAVDIEGREEGDVGLGEIAHHSVAEATVGHIDDGFGGDGVDMSVADEGVDVADGYHVVAGLFEATDEVGRVAHGSAHHYGGAVGAPAAFATGPLGVGSHAREAEVFALGMVNIEVVDHLGGGFGGRLGLRGGKALAVDVGAHVGEHIAVVGAATAREIGSEGGGVGGVDAHYIVVGAGDGCGEHRCA